MDPDGKGGGEERRGAEGGATVIRVYYMRKESIVIKLKKIMFVLN